MTTTVISEYTTALQNGFNTYAKAVLPAPTPLPVDRYEVNLRSDRPADANNGISVPAIYEHAVSHARIDIGLRSGENLPIHAPKRGVIHVDVAPETRACLDVQIQNDMPTAMVVFNKPLWVRDPLDGATGAIASALAGYWLESIEFDKRGAVIAHGRIADRWGLMSKRWSQSLLNNSPEDRNSHGFFRLVQATGRAAAHTIPDVVRHGAGRLFGLAPKNDPQPPAQDDDALLLSSVFKLLEPGALTARGSITADKPLVVRLNGAELLLSAQDFCYAINADVVPSSEGLQLDIRPDPSADPSTWSLRSDALAFNLQGCLVLQTNRTLAGSDVNLQIKKTRFDAFINNGKADNMLVPLHIESHGDERNVADVRGDFHFGSELNVSGEARFAVPATIHDTQRDVVVPQGHLHIDSHDFDMVMEGDVTQRQNVFADRPLVVPERQARVHFGVREMDLRGHLNSNPANCPSGVQASVPIHIRASNPERRALRIDANYQARGKTNPETQTGVTVGFLLPMRVDPPTRLAVNTSAGGVELNRLVFTAVGEAHLGSHVRQPGLDVEGKGAAIIERIDGTIHANPNGTGGISLTNAADLRLCGSHPDAGNRPQAGLKLLVKRPTNGTLQIRGHGGLTVPCELPDSQMLSVQIPGGMQRVRNAKARLRCDPFVFETGPAGQKLDADIFTEYAAELRGSYGTHVAYDKGALRLSPQSQKTVPATHDSSTSGSEGYQSAREDRDAPE